MVVDQFVSDAHELTQVLAERFDVPKIRPIAHSWVSIRGKELESPSDRTSPRQACLYQRRERRTSPIDRLP